MIMRYFKKQIFLGSKDSELIIAQLHKRLDDAISALGRITNYLNH